MTLTARRAAAQRRKRLLIAAAVRERIQREIQRGQQSQARSEADGRTAPALPRSVDLSAAPDATAATPDPSDIATPTKYGSPAAPAAPAA
jgi:hypothetical protein